MADLDAALLHNSLGVVDEKITGNKAWEYTDVVYQEAQLYMSDEQSLEDTVKHIKERGDKVLSGK